MKRIALFILLLTIILARPLWLVYSERSTFFSPGYHTQYERLKQAYNQSQYHQKKRPVIMSDADFEKFAGGAFLKGLNPILIVHDHPPLGRYVISLSILLFDNPNTIMLFVMALIVVSFYLLAVEVLGNKWLALIPAGIFINEPLFMWRLSVTPLPEPIQLPFLLLAFYFFLRGLTGKREWSWFLLASFMIGGVISTRFFVLGAAVTATMIIYLWISHRFGRKMLVFLGTLPAALIVLFLSYTRTIQLGTSLLGVLSIQKYILAYHKSKFILPFSVWDLLLFNRWHTWWGSRAIVTDPLWSPLWLLATVGTIASVISAIKERFKEVSEGEKLLMLWVLIHLTMLSTGYTSTRYFLPLIPMLYLLTTAFFFRWYSNRKELSPSHTKNSTKKK